MGINWFEMRSQGIVTKAAATVLIEKWLEWINNNDPDKDKALKKTVEVGVQKYVPKFIVLSKPEQRGPDQDKIDGLDVEDDVDAKPQKRAKKNKFPKFKGKLGQDFDDPIDIDEIAPIERVELTPEQKADLEKRKKEQEEFDIESRTPVIKVTAKGYIKPDIFDKCYAVVSSGKNLLLSGPAGCGKTKMTEVMAKVMKKTHFNKSFGGGQSYGHVFGGKDILPDGTTKWVPSDLLNTMAIAKHLINLDEPFAADPDILLGLNGILEPSTRVFRSPTGIIKVAKSTYFTACSNTVGRNVSRQYTGANRTDDSLLDRFVTIPMEYDLNVERLLVESLISNQLVAAFFQKSLSRLRASIRTNNIPFDPSTRRLINCCEIYNSGLSRHSAFEYAFLSTLSANERTRVD